MPTVSIFKKITDVNNPFNKSVEYCLNRIREGKSKDFVEQLRLMNEEDYSKNKSKLPVVCFNGRFKHRSISGIIEHSGLIILDFDKFKTTEEAIEFKDSICSDEYVFSVWISPSALGVKILVKIPGIIENHKGYFQSLKKYFNHPNWDDSGSDVSRTCFESYDPEIYINYESSRWTELEEPEIEEIGTYEPLVRMTSSNQIVEKLLVWWSKKYGMNKGSRNNNLHKLASAFNDFSIDISDAMSECKKLSNDLPEKEVTALVNSAYKRPSAGKAFEDSQAVEKIEKMVRSGKSVKEIEKLHKDIDVSRIKENLDIDEFWYYNDKGKVVLSTHKFKFWLEQNNFFKYYPSAQSNTFTFIKKEQNLLEETNEKRIKDYVLKNILERSNIGYGPYDYMASNSGYFKPDFLSMLDTTEVEIKEDTLTECYLYFKNCVVKVTGDNIEKIDYLDLDGYVWRRQIIDRNFEPFDHHASIFRTYLWLASGKDVQKYNSLKSVIGYLLHSFKTSANNKAIIFNDETISENPNGGSGKGIFWNGLKNMKKVSRIDGKMFEPTKTFPYQTVSTDTQILVFDDVKKNFNFENLFSLITEGITLEYKGQDAITIPVEKSPKILILLLLVISNFQLTKYNSFIHY